MIDRSRSPALISATSCSRLVATRRRTSTPGWSFWKRASRWGTKYLAVLTMPMVSSPCSMRFKRAIAWSASLSAASSRLAWIRKYSPAVDSVTVRPLRSNSGRPTCDSISLICIDTAGGVRCSVSAARAMLPCWATSVKTRSCRNVMFMTASLAYGCAYGKAQVN